MSNLNLTLSPFLPSPELCSQVHFYLNIDPVPIINESRTEPSSVLIQSLPYDTQYFHHYPCVCKALTMETRYRNSFLNDLSASGLSPVYSISSNISHLYY